LERRIAQVDKTIDAAVYRLYDLSAEEIAMVEGEKAFSRKHKQQWKFSGREKDVSPLLFAKKIQFW
jgi:hypothetical protein